MPRVTAPADKRFRRSHVKPSSKRSSRIRQALGVARTLALLGLLGYAGWRGTALLSRMTLLQVSRITVTGNERLSMGEVTALLEGLHGRHILALSLDEWQAKLLASPWVQEASLRRVLPSTIEITVRERKPIAVGRVGSALYLVDAHGVVVDEYGPAYKDFDLPIVDGLSVKRGGDAQVDEKRAALAAKLLAALATRPDMAERVSQIDVSDARDAVVMLQGDTTLLRIGDEDFIERLQQYIDLGDALRERVTSIDYVDLRFAERLYVRPTRGSGPVTVPASARARR